MEHFAKRPRPFRQGSLDGLCGVYSVINATRLAAWPSKRLTETDCTELFVVLTSQLAADRCLHRVLTEGSAYPVVSKLLRATGRWLATKHELHLSYQRPFHSTYRVSADKALWRLGVHLNAPQTAAIVYLAEPWDDHWSVVRAISRTDLLVLFDSGRRRFARIRSASGVGSSRRKVLHRDLFLIRVRC